LKYKKNFEKAQNSWKELQNEFQWKFILNFFQVLINLKYKKNFEKAKILGKNSKMNSNGNSF
jgi:hypothetical protein